MQPIPDETVMFTGSLRELLGLVSQLMLMPKASRQHLPSLFRVDSPIPANHWSGLWFGASSALLASCLGEAELELRLNAVYDSTTGNLYLGLIPGDESLGFLTTGQAIPLYDRYRAGQA